MLVVPLGYSLARTDRLILFCYFKSGLRTASRLLLLSITPLSEI